MVVRLASKVVTGDADAQLCATLSLQCQRHRVGTPNVAARAVRLHTPEGAEGDALQRPRQTGFIASAASKAFIFVLFEDSGRHVGLATAAQSSEPTLLQVLCRHM